MTSCGLERTEARPKQREQLDVWCEASGIQMRRASFLQPRISKERPNMKENPVVDGVTDPAKPLPRGTTPPSKPQKKKSSPDSLSFAPERIQAQASAKSTVLIQILEREETTYYSRHWGINE